MSQQSSRHGVLPPSLPPSINNLTDEELFALVEERDYRKLIGCEKHPFTIRPLVWHIAHDTVVKHCCNTSTIHEPFMMEYVRQRTSIPVPRVQKVLPSSTPNSFWLIMDYVEGNTLHAVWDTLSSQRQSTVADSLRRYVQELRQLPLPYPETPGPFDGTGQPIRCNGNYFTEEGVGPFASYEAMAAWFDHQRYCHQVMAHKSKRPPFHCPKFDTSLPLVLCHNDLHMRNIMLDSEDRVWILDWAFAGAFPPWFEYAHFAIWENIPMKVLRPPKSFTSFSSHIAGNFKWYMEEYLDKLVPEIDAYGILNMEKGYFDELGISVD